jgi:hypothetical protein
MVEAAIILSVFVLIIMGMLELALVVFRYNWVSEAARQGARTAIVRGALAGDDDPPVMNSWPATHYDDPPTYGAYEHPATTDDEIINSMQPYLTLLDPAKTTVRVEWLDGNNQVDSRVRFSVTTTHEAFLTSFFGGKTWTLNGTSTMRIVH